MFADLPLPRRGGGLEVAGKVVICGPYKLVYAQFEVPNMANDLLNSIRVSLTVTWGI